MQIIMKKAAISRIMLGGFLVLFFSCKNPEINLKVLNARSNTLRLLKNDTIVNYFDTFEKNKNDYMGKSFQCLYDDIKVPIQSYREAIVFSNVAWADGITLMYVDNDAHFWLPQDSSLTYSTLYVNFEEHFPADTLLTLNKVKHGTTWNKRHVKYLKNFTVKNIEVHKRTLYDRKKNKGE